MVLAPTPVADAMADNRSEVLAQEVVRHGVTGRLFTAALKGAIMASPPKGVAIVARKGARSRVALSAAARLPTGRSTEISIVEISSGGFLAEFPSTLMPGAMLRIELPGIPPRQARVMRRRGGTTAFAFLPELTPQELALLKE